jgi:hypothetical protein
MLKWILKCLENMVIEKEVHEEIDLSLSQP